MPTEAPTHPPAHTGFIPGSEHQYGVVIIGRNEGERLRICLESVRQSGVPLVYVDSGSTDGSVAMAKSLGADVVSLDMQIPFTAARARNEGFACLCQKAPQLTYVQFVDGDCEVVDGWLKAAVAFLDSTAQVAAVCGRRRERYPQRSIYNALCDSEWDTAIGQARTCGGDVMVRVDAFRAVGGFKPELIAGEEPELCVRLRQAGWKIWRLDVEMTMHDAAMMRFSQWWMRSMRAGYAFAQGASLHGAPPEFHCVKSVRRIWLWGLLLPVLIVFSGAINFWSVLLALVYPIQVIRIAMREGGAAAQNWVRASFLVMGKFPEMVGASKFLWHRVSGRVGVLIEYK